MDLGGPEGSGVEILEEDEGQGVGTRRDEVAIPLFGTEKLEKISGLGPHRNPGREAGEPGNEVERIGKGEDGEEGQDDSGRFLVFPETQRESHRQSRLGVRRKSCKRVIVEVG